VGNSGCGAGAVPSKQAKQTSKGLVFNAVRVRWQWCGAKQTSKARVRVYPSKDKMAWLGAVLSAMVGCKVKVFGLVRWWVLCASKGLVFGAVLGAKQWC
jgi:hypothetical protein